MTHSNVDTLASRADENSGLLVGDEELHLCHVAYRVLSVHDDLTELHIFAYGGSSL